LLRLGIRDIERAADVIRRGGVVAFPTDTLYGLAADPFNADAVRRIFDVKGRSGDRGLPLVAADTAQVERSIGSLSPTASRLASRFWPGPLTLLLPAPASLDADVTGQTGRVGVRVPAHPVARQLCEAAGSVLIATSANVSGQPATNDPEDVAAALSLRIDALLDVGKTPGGAPSTIVDVLDEPPRLIRAGAISWDDVQSCLKGM
jgi:L-threonylcarbamoyladenylate synthase